MASAAGIKAGRAYVEVGADDSALRAALKGAEVRVRAFGNAVGAVGRGLMGLGAAALVPFGAATKAFASYEDAMASLRAAANPTAEELQRVQAATMDISKATGVGPAKVAAAMTELLKAGMSVDTVLGGATQATLQFAKVADMDAAQAATVLADAMNVFGVDATTAVNTLSRAADASSISVQDVAMSFSQASAVAKLAGLSIDETANAIAILGNAGIKGSDAGTSLKTMMTRLMAPTDEAAGMMRALGVNVREADGSMMSMRGIVGQLQSRIGGLSDAARDKALFKIFGSDAIRASAVLLKGGVRGWDEFNGKMAEGLPISAKYDSLMDTLSGHGQRAMAAMERLGVAVGATVAPAMGVVADRIASVSDFLIPLVKNNAAFVADLAKGAALVVGFGAALTGVSIAAKVLAPSLQAVGFAFGAITAAPLLVGLAAAGAAFLVLTGTGQRAMAMLRGDLDAALGGMGDALAAGDVATAGRVLWAGLGVEWARGVAALQVAWGDFLAAMSGSTAGVMANVSAAWATAWVGMQSAPVLAAAGVQSAWAGGMVAIQDAVAAAGVSIQTTWNTVAAAVQGGFILMAKAADLWLLATAPQFWVLKHVAVAVFQALPAIFDTTLGMIRGAWDVTVTALNVSWQAFAKVFGAVVNTLGEVFAPAVDILRGIWDAVVGGMTAAWQMFSDTFGVVAGAIAKVGEAVFGGLKALIDGLGGALQAVTGFLGGLVKTAGDMLGINKALDEFNQKQKGAGDANEKIRQDAKSASEARQKELDARLAAIKAEQQHKLDELGAGKPDPDAAAAEAASAAAAAEAERQRRMQEAQAGVDAAQAEFQAALADARQENAPAPDLTDVTGEAAKARALANLAAEGEGISPGMIGAGLERAQRTVDISGGFNAAAFKGLGVGDTVADHVKDQVKEQKKSNDLLGRVVRNTGQIGVANEP